MVHIASATITVYVYGNVDAEKIIKGVNDYTTERTDKIMAAVDDVKGGLAGLGTDLDEIATDVDTILAKLTVFADAGMTPEQVHEVIGIVSTLKGRTREIGDKVPPPPPPPERTRK